MTIAISIKINDGVVLAADSASTLLGLTPNGELAVINVYNHANKLFNLRKGFPIGALTWGAGSIGPTSVETVVKDLRLRFSGKDKKHLDWKLHRNGYTVEGIAQKLKEYIYDSLYQSSYKGLAQNQKPSLGFIVAGFSPNAPMADEFQIDIQNGECDGPRRLRNQDQSGATWAGEIEALNRLVMGWATELPTLLQAQLNIPPNQISAAMSAVQQRTQIPFVLPAMPLQDAIDLAKFMVDVTKRFSHHRPGPPTVGGAIEIAAISKHEGFRWVERKYYFKRELNPDEEYSRVYSMRGRQEDEEDAEGEGGSNE